MKACADARVSLEVSVEWFGLQEYRYKNPSIEELQGWFPIHNIRYVVPFITTDVIASSFLSHIHIQT